MNVKMANWLEENDFLLKDVAEALGYKLSVIHFWKVGHYDLTFNHVLRWLLVYNINPVTEFGLKLSRLGQSELDFYRQQIEKEDKNGGKENENSINDSIRTIISRM